MTIIVAVMVLAASASSGGYGAFEQNFKARMTGAAEAMAEEGFRTSPVVTWMAGWDFDQHCWRLNEYKNQMIHRFIGGFTNRTLGRGFSLLVGAGIELQQYLGKDAFQLKGLDRIRDIAYYVIG